MERSERSRRASEAGFSIVEGLIAALILAIILIGILPLVTRSMQNNMQGNDATNESNAVTDRLEMLYALPFNDPNLELVVAAPSLVSSDSFSLANGTWGATTGGADDQYTRNVTVEYFGGADLSEDGELNTALPGGSLPGAVQLKRITMTIDKRRALGASSYQVVALKAY